MNPEFYSCFPLIQFSFRVKFSQFQGFVIAHACGVYPVSMWIIVAPLLKHIVNILLLIAGPKVSGIYTRRIVATGAIVMNLKIDRERVSAKNPRKFVSGNRFIKRFKSTMPEWSFTSRPNPTPVRRTFFINLGPEIRDLLVGEFDRAELINENCFGRIHNRIVNFVSDRLGLHTPSGCVLM